MHPVLANRRRLALYLFTWLLLAILLALLVIEPGRRAIPAAVVLTLPPTILYAFACLAAWYPVRAMPLERTNSWTLLVSHAFAAMVLGGVWLMLFRFSAQQQGGAAAIEQRAPALFVAGALLYLLAVALHYLLVAIERTAGIEKQEIEVRMLAREAELKVLKAQLDPHFLFNSLNSISSLCGSNPASARTLTTLLAEYLRKSLRTGSAESITLSEELELASSYLAIERIRFGPRLEFAQDIDESVRTYRVPPLLLQPLVENAVKHGIGQLLDGGTLQIAAVRDGEHVRISVDNACDPDRVPQEGENIGLANTRRRVEMFYGPAARMEIVNEPLRFRVALVLPRMITAVIVDDEAPARAIVREYLSDYPNFVVAAECANGYEAVKAVSEHRPDLLFLDIQMPKLDGFEVLDLLETKPHVVFVTAYDEYAIRAFEVHAIDYLLKPFTAARFAEVIAHAEAMVGRPANVASVTSSIRKPLQRIAFRDGATIDVVPVQRIDYVEAQDDYVHVWSRGTRYVKQQPLGELEAMLDATRFIRVHRSYVVNLESLARVEPYAKDSRVALLKDGTRIPVSRAGYERLKGLL